MTTLSANAPRAIEHGEMNHIPVIASDIIYEGAAVGIVKASGHARPLTSSDEFVGFAAAKADNSSGSAADINVEVVHKGQVQLSVTGAVITDVGQPVYATDDNAFTFLKASAVFIGIVKRFVSSGVVIVEFGKDIVDPWAGLVAETISDNKTTDAQDTGKLLQIDTDAKAFTLHATAAGQRIVLANAGAYGTVILTASPNANDKIMGPDIAGADNKDLVNTKATANRGDYIDLIGDGADGWVIQKMKGTWAQEA